MTTPNIEITGLIEPFIKAYKALNNEYSHLFDIGLEEYVTSQIDKYYYTNTFLHRAEKVNFLKYYFPIKVVHNKKSSLLNNLKKDLLNLKYITIVGSAGSGKSTLVKYIFINSILQNFKIPILIELRHLNDFEGDLEKLIFKKILKNRIEPSDSIAIRTLKEGRFLFLLDGYDELYIEENQKVNEQIESFVDSYSNNNFIITTRPGSGIENFSRFKDYLVAPLLSTEIELFVNKMIENTERKERIIETIKNPANINYSGYLSNPLLLSMFILAFESHPEIPHKKTAFYRNVFDTLYSKHDGITKNSFLRQKKTKLQREEFQSILELFSFITYTEGLYAFTFEAFNSTMQTVRKRFESANIDSGDLLYDLETAISIFVKDGFEYKFPHRSLQEYFSAEFVNKLPYDKKQIGYEKLLKHKSGFSADDKFNIWTLCEELDEQSLLKYFVIPELKTIVDELDESDSVSLFNKFNIIVGMSLGINNEDEKGYNIALFRVVNFEHTLFNFFNINDYLEYFSFVNNKNLKTEIENFLMSQGLSLLDNDWYDIRHNDNQLIEIFLKNGFEVIITDYRNSVLQKIDELEAKLINEKNLLNEILGL